MTLGSPVTGREKSIKSQEGPQKDKGRRRLPAVEERGKTGGTGRR